MRKVIAEANDISFGAAILLVKDGYKIQRKGWNGREQYVELANDWRAFR